MKLHKLTTILLTLMICLIAPCTVMAQSSGDNLYNQGLQLQKTMTVKAQNSAIDKFAKAKRLYDSKAKKDQCDKAIEVSRGIIKSLSSSSPSSGAKSKPVVVKEPSISVSNNEFGIDCQAKSLTVAVAVSNVDSWKAMPVSNDDGTSFLSVTKSSDGSSITIRCEANNTTIERSQVVEVSGGDVKATVTVIQQGQPVNITAEKTLLEFGKKGGKKDDAVLCNATETYAENNDRNWRIISKPDWVDVVIVNKSQKTGGLLGKIKDKVVEVAVGEDDAPVDTDMEETPIAVSVEKIAKGTAEFENGRKGELIIGAGTKTVTILITQK